jgi:hypothetical protein
MWKAQEDRNEVLYSQEQVISFLCKDLDLDTYYSKEELVMIAHLTYQIQETIPSDDKSHMPKLMLLAFTLGHKYAQFMERQHVSVHKDNRNEFS